MPLSCKTYVELTPRYYHRATTVYNVVVPGDVHTAPTCSLGDSMLILISVNYLCLKLLHRSRCIIVLLVDKEVYHDGQLYRCY